MARSGGIAVLASRADVAMHPLERVGQPLPTPVPSCERSIFVAGTGDFGLLNAHSKSEARN